MTDQLLELGEIGILRDIPSEMNSLTDQNIILKQDIAKLKSSNRILIIILGVVSAYLIYRTYFKPGSETEDYEITDIKHGK